MSTSPHRRPHHQHDRTGFKLPAEGWRCPAPAYDWGLGYTIPHMRARLGCPVLADIWEAYERFSSEAVKALALKYCCEPTYIDQMYARRVAIAVMEEAIAMRVASPRIRSYMDPFGGADDEARKPCIEFCGLVEECPRGIPFAV